LIEH
jgi:hypothetical protein